MKASAGYSGKPLAMKLGIREGFRVSFVGAPSHYRSLLGPLPPGVEVIGSRGTRLDLLHLFALDQPHLITAMPRAKGRIKVDGMLWVSWPKQTSRISTDLNETAVREIGLSNGLVDVKVAAVDDDWSGLKFVYRLKDRH